MKHKENPGEPENPVRKPLEGLDVTKKSGSKGTLYS